MYPGERISLLTTPYSWELRVMREVLRRDGVVVLFGDNGDNDEVYVEPVIAAFVPINGNLHCGCGADVQPWNIRRVFGGLRTDMLKTVSLIARLIGAATDLVVGLAAGSLTVMHVATEMQRRFIGCDIACGGAP